MFLKLGIIIGVVIISGIIFSSEINALFPNTATAINSLEDDVKNLGSKAVDSAEKRMEESFDKIVDKTNETLNDEFSKAEETISKISETKESSQDAIMENITNFNPIESIQSIFTNNNKQ